MHADALGPSTAGMWHDPNGIMYPYDDEDRRILAAAEKRRAEQAAADCMNIHDE